MILISRQVAAPEVIVIPPFSLSLSCRHRSLPRVSRHSLVTWGLRTEEKYMRESARRERWNPDDRAGQSTLHPIESAFVAKLRRALTFYATCRSVDELNSAGIELSSNALPCKGFFQLALKLICDDHVGI